MNKNLISELHFQDECRFMPEHSWLFAAMDFDIPNKGDYLLVNIFDTDVIIHKVSDSSEIAYTNSCPHRGSAFFINKKGNSSIQCPYHGWTFNESGNIKAIPFAERYEPCTADKKLDLWKIDKCGAFIFITRNSSSTLKEYLGTSVSEILQQSSSNFGKEICHTERVVNANWKILLQNTVEPAHIFMVHPRSFQPIVANPISAEGENTNKPHIYYRVDLNSEASNARQMKILKKIFNIQSDPNKYNHLLVFSGLTLGFTSGLTYSIVTYRPVDKSRTSVISRMFFCKEISNDTASLYQEIISQISQSQTELFNTILEEDAAICEIAQRGICNSKERNNSYSIDERFAYYYKINVLEEAAKWAKVSA